MKALLHIMAVKPANFHENLTKDVGGVTDTKFGMYGGMDTCTHAWADKGHFYSSPPPKLGDISMYVQLLSRRASYMYMVTVF